MSDVTVRRAKEQDAAALGLVHVQGWHEAYAGRMPQEILDGLDPVTRGEGWRRIIRGEFPGEDSDVWVAEKDGDLIGFASAGASRDDDAIPARAELYAIYVLAAHHGTGTGQALLDAAIGDAECTLWVLDDNPRAQAFYRRNGFTRDGAVTDDDRWDPAVREAGMVREAVR